MLKAYYAHCLAIYNTPQEKRDVSTIRSLGFEVVNPNSNLVEEALASIPKEERIFFFKKFADECHLIVFRALPDGSIPSGVAKEIGWFEDLEKPVIELPSAISRRTLTLDETREYLMEVGQR